jgi:hypothetical protein
MDWRQRAASPPPRGNLTPIGVQQECGHQPLALDVDVASALEAETLLFQDLLCLFGDLEKIKKLGKKAKNGG